MTITTPPVPSKVTTFYDALRNLGSLGPTGEPLVWRWSPETRSASSPAATAGQPDAKPTMSLRGAKSGPTDTDNLVLLCVRDHHQLHGQQR